MPTQLGDGAGGRLPPFAVSACTTYHSSFAEDLANYRALDIDGIGLWEYKLPQGRDDETVARFQESGLTATFCFPNVPGHLRRRLHPGNRRITRASGASSGSPPARPAGLGGSWPASRDVGAAAARLNVAAWQAAYAGVVNVRPALEVIRGPGGSLARRFPGARPDR
jgi:hypothetical protein